VNINKTIDKVDKVLSRRTFLAAAGSVAAAGALAGCGDDGTVTLPTTSSSSYSDLDILNFALNLEYLEAQFYAYMATGAGLSSSDLTGGTSSAYQTVGTVKTTNTYNNTTYTVGKVAGLTTGQQQIINEIAFEEQQHVRALRFLLGANAVAMPNIDLTFFGPLAVAATIYTDPNAFNPSANFDSFLIGSFIFEDVGVTAYAGAAPLISAAGVASGYLNDAAGILAVEAYHAAYVRTALTARSVGQTTTAYPYVAVANKVEALRQTLTKAGTAPSTTTTGNTGQADSSSTVEITLTTPTSISSLSNIVACDSQNAIGFARTVNEVHHIVYGSGTVGVKAGGFFPNGTNSIFATTTA
jgi:hypothetical protein